MTSNGLGERRAAMEPVSMAAALAGALTIAVSPYPFLTALSAGFLFMVLGRLYCRLTTGMCDCPVRMEGRTVFVTGATAGIGKETALDLARRGARVILGCRDLDKGRRVRQEMVRLSGNEDLHVQRLDLASLASVRQCARELLAREPTLHVLVNNAGMASEKREVTEDGFEMVFQSNHLGHFLLTSLLLDLLKRSSPSRIVVVSSLGHKRAKIDLDDLQSEKGYRSWWSYWNSKLANILFTRELSSRLHGTGVTVNAVNPGIVKTDVVKDHHTALAFKYMKFMFFWIGKTPFEGAQTSIYLAVHPEVEQVTGKYFSDCKELQPSKAARDDATAKKLWQISEDLVGSSTQ